MSLYCKRKQRPAKFSIITPECAVWLCGVMHIVEFFVTFYYYTPWCDDAHHKVWLSGRMHTTESDSMVGCTPRSLTQWWNAHHRVWFNGGMNTAESDSMVGCTPRSLIQWCDAHRGVWFNGGMHTAESESLVGCTPRSLIHWWDAHHGVWFNGLMHDCGVRLCNVTLTPSTNYFHFDCLYKNKLDLFYSCRDASPASLASLTLTVFAWYLCVSKSVEYIKIPQCWDI